MISRFRLLVGIALAGVLACAPLFAQGVGKKPEEAKPDLGKAAKEMRAVKGFHFSAKTSVKAPGMPGGDTGQGAGGLEGQGINPALAHGTSTDGNEIASTSKTTLVKLANTDKWVTPPSSDPQILGIVELSRFPFHAMQEMERLKKGAKVGPEEKVGETSCWVVECAADKDYVKATVQRMIKSLGEQRVPINVSMIDWNGTSIVFKAWISKDRSLPLKFARNANISIRSPMGNASITEETTVELDFSKTVEDTLPADVLKKLGPNK